METFTNSETRAILGILAPAKDAEQRLIKNWLELNDNPTCVYYTADIQSLFDDVGLMDIERYMMIEESVVTTGFSFDEEYCILTEDNTLRSSNDIKALLPAGSSIYKMLADFAKAGISFEGVRELLTR